MCRSLKFRAPQLYEAARAEYVLPMKERRGVCRREFGSAVAMMVSRERAPDVVRERVPAALQRRHALNSVQGALPFHGSNVLRLQAKARQVCLSPPCVGVRRAVFSVRPVLFFAERSPADCSLRSTYSCQGCQQTSFAVNPTTQHGMATCA